MRPGRGIYQEHINYNGKAVWVRSEHGVASTTIDGSGAAYIETLNIWGYTVQRIQGSVVAFVNSERYSSVLDGFTITNGSGTTSTFLEIQDDGYLSSYRWTESKGGGIYCGVLSTSFRLCTYAARLG